LGCCSTFRPSTSSPPTSLSPFLPQIFRGLGDPRAPITAGGPRLWTHTALLWALDSGARSLGSSPTSRGAQQNTDPPPGISPGSCADSAWRGYKKEWSSPGLAAPCLLRAQILGPRPVVAMGPSPCRGNCFTMGDADVATADSP
jgi:hypothetical protein